MILLKKCVLCDDNAGLDEALLFSAELQMHQAEPAEVITRAIRALQQQTQAEQDGGALQHLPRHVALLHAFLVQTLESDGYSRSDDPREPES